MDFEKAIVDGHFQKRAATTGGILQPIERDEDNPRPKTHFPFVTKIQVRIKKGEMERECSSRNDQNSQNESTSKAQSVRPTNFTLRDTPGTRSSSKSTFYEHEMSPMFELGRESLNERRRLRRKMLGERALASVYDQNEQEKDSLFRPRFSARDCSVQLLLVSELTEHLHLAKRETRCAQKQSFHRSAAFPSRATKGERLFRINKCK